MAAAQAIRDGDTLRVQGDLDFDSVVGLLTATETWFADAALSRIDLGEVSRSNSAGVALLVHWLRLAQNHERELDIVNIPAQMWAIIKIVDLETLLPVA